MKRLFNLVIVIFLTVLILSATGCSSMVDVEEYNKVVEERDSLSTTCEQYKTDIESANSTITGLTAQLGDIASSKAELQSEFDDYVKKSTAFNALLEAEKQSALDVASKKAEIEKLTNSADELNASITDLSAQKAALESEIYALENKIIEYKEKPVQLTNGNYTAGVDFPVGTYDLYAVSGKGTVSTDNSSDYGNSIYEMMGVSDRYYIPNYQNVKLTDGTVLKVSGVTIELRVKAN